MSENQTEKQTKIPHRIRLLGKVVLLIGNDTSLLQNLISQLANKGADIALLCRQISQEEARKIKECVQASGSRLCLIEQSDYNSSTTSQLIDSTVAKMAAIPAPRLK